jgi:hypothetical protein
MAYRIEPGAELPDEHGFQDRRIIAPPDPQHVARLEIHEPLMLPDRASHPYDTHAHV